jgi:hypothetical protein
MIKYNNNNEKVIDPKDGLWIFIFVCRLEVFSPGIVEASFGYMNGSSTVKLL